MNKIYIAVALLLASVNVFGRSGFEKKSISRIDQAVDEAIWTHHPDSLLFCMELNAKPDDLSSWFALHPEFTYIGGDIEDVVQFGHYQTFYRKTYFIKTQSLTDPAVQYEIGAGYYENKYPYCCRASSDKKENKRKGYLFLNASATQQYNPALLYCGTISFNNNDLQNAKYYYYTAFNNGCEEAVPFIEMLEDKKSKDNFHKAISIVGVCAVIGGLCFGIKTSVDNFLYKKSGAEDKINKNLEKIVQEANKIGLDHDVMLRDLTNQLSCDGKKYIYISEPSGYSNIISGYW